MGWATPGWKFQTDLAVGRVLRYREVFGKARKWSKSGLYCCPTCSAAFWRILSIPDLIDVDAEKLQAEGMASLRQYRTEKGWRGFPFFYTLMSLTEFTCDEARRELRNVRPLLEQHAKTPGKDADILDRRRAVVVKRALARA